MQTKDNQRQLMCCCGQGPFPDKAARKKHILQMGPREPGRHGAAEKRALINESPAIVETSSASRIIVPPTEVVDVMAEMNLERRVYEDTLATQDQERLAQEELLLINECPPAGLIAAAEIEEENITAAVATRSHNEVELPPVTPDPLRRRVPTAPYLWLFGAAAFVLAAVTLIYCLVSGVVTL